MLNKCHLFSKGKLIKCCLTADWYLIIHSNEWLCTYMTQGRLFKIKKLKRADPNLNLSKIKLFSLFLTPFLFYFLYKNKCVLMEFKCPWWLRALVNFSWILIFRLIVRGNQRKHFNWFNLRIVIFNISFIKLEIFFLTIYVFTTYLLYFISVTLLNVCY